MLNREKFYGAVRSSLFHGVLSQAQVDGMNAVLDEWEGSKWKDHRKLAYMLSTDFHETAYTMQAIEEYGKGKGRKYGSPDPKTGKTYYGRGLVQLTWDYNYQKAGEKIGVDLYHHPELALDMANAVRIMFNGMHDGWFTGKKLSNYINDKMCDYFNARRIINGTDKAATLEGYAKKFQKALEGAQEPDAAPAVA
jgi:putative chitinase